MLSRTLFFPYFWLCFSQCNMSEVIKIKKGLNINMVGEASGEPKILNDFPSKFAVIPDDYIGLTPKPLKKEGDSVVAGEALFADKHNPAIVVTSPVCGTITKIARGERRKILSFEIDADGDQSKRQSFQTANLSDENIIATLLASGLWAMLRQRPYGIVPDPSVRPRDIFISTFDTSPLAPDHTLYISGQERHFDKGVEILSKLTTGRVYIGCTENHVYNSDFATTKIFSGPHPAGNIGTQIAAVAPVNKGETVWAVDGETVVRIGHLFAEGFVDYSCIVAVTGENVVNPCFIKTTAGIALSKLLHDNIKAQNSRIISGNVLTGTQESIDGYLRFPFRQTTVIPEINNDCEFMGWASLSPKKYSAAHTFFSWLAPKSKKYRFDAKINGSERAIIMAGEYDKVFPMDIYAEYLIKAIIARDIDKMEQLGIYEVVPEDFALCEFIDTSKLPLQEIVKNGLEYLRKELS